MIPVNEKNIRGLYPGNSVQTQRLVKHEMTAILLFQAVDIELWQRVHRVKDCITVFTEFKQAYRIFSLIRSDLHNNFRFKHGQNGFDNNIPETVHLFL